MCVCDLLQCTNELPFLHLDAYPATITVRRSHTHTRPVAVGIIFIFKCDVPARSTACGCVLVWPVLEPQHQTGNKTGMHQTRASPRRHLLHRDRT